MGTGNPGTTTASKATQAAADASPDCVELDKANDDRRKELAGRTKDKTLIGKDGKGTGNGTTVSSVKRTPIAGGSTKVRSAHNNHKAHEKCPKTLAQGGEKAVREGAPTTCGYTHAEPTMQKSGHAEARLLDELKNATPRRMTFNIDWRPTVGKPSKMPCPSCHAMICAAISPPCKHEVTLCAQGNKPVPVTQDHCPADPASYDRLKTAMGEQT